MKRSLLIAGGTFGGLGAVMMITPPNLSETTSIAIDTPAPAPSATPTQSGAPSATPTQSGAPSAKPTAAAPTVAPTVAPTKPVGGVTGSFTGSVANTRYGPVQVKITVENGKIVDAQAVQAPSGSNDRYTQKAVPRLREQTIAAQSANVQGVSGASFTSYGWYQSLASAISKAGL
jgi:uncharacterized protein with FMN-binding domain